MRDWQRQLWRPTRSGGSKVKDHEKITQDEMIELFGRTMPMEAVKLCFEWTGSVDQLRVELRKIARQEKEPNSGTD